MADSHPAFSPDGSRLAYASCSYSEVFRAGVGECDVFLVELQTAGTVAGAPRQLTTQRSTLVNSLAWARDGSALIYSRFTQPWLSYLWRVGADGLRPPERIELAGPNATAPAIALARDRLAFTRIAMDTDIYQFEVGHPARLVTGSSFVEQEPRLSPDGRRLAFGSARAGGDTVEIWVAEADGSKPQQLTHGGRHRGSPFWSSDGRRIAFDSLDDDLHFHIWVVDADGGTPRRLTTQTTDDEIVPTWSHDGRWVYFSGGQGAARSIWRVPATGGTPERVTRGFGGPFACESADSRSLLFQTNSGDSPLMIMPLAGGDTRQLAACVKGGAFGAGVDGVYYVPCDPGVTRRWWPHAGASRSSDSPLHVMDLQTLHDRRLGILEGLRDRPLGLSVSPDGKRLVYPKQVVANADLMLIENFR